MKCRIWIYDHEILYEFITWSWGISWNHMLEFMCMNSSLNSCQRIHDNEIIYEFIIMKLTWIHVWIQCCEEYREIMAEFLEMNSHMKSWLNSLISKYSRFSLIVSGRENVLLIQSNRHSFFAVSLLQALGCASLLLSGDQSALLRLESGAAHSAGRTWMAL